MARPSEAGRKHVSEEIIRVPGRLVAWTLITTVAMLCAQTSTAVGRVIVRQLSKAGDVSTYPDVANLPRGRAIVTWTELGHDNKYTVMSSEMTGRSAGWSKAKALSGEMNLAAQPVVATTAAGAAVVVWYAETSAGDYVAAASRAAPYAAWSKPFNISGINAGGIPTVAADGADSALVAWSTGVGPSQVRATEFNLGTRRFMPAVVLQQARVPLLRVSAAANARGQAVVVWERYRAGAPLGSSGITNTVEAATQTSPEAPWSGPHPLGTEYEPAGQNSATTQLPGPHVALSSDGRIATCWQGRSHGLAVPDADFGAIKSGWQHLETASHRSALDPQVAVSSNGGATLIWEHKGSIQVDSTRWDKRWPRARTLQGSRQTNSSDPQIVENGKGRVVASWSSGAVQVAVHRLSDRWTRPRRLGAGGVATVAIDGNRDATIAWQHPTIRPRGISVVATNLHI